MKLYTKEQLLKAIQFALEYQKATDYQEIGKILMDDNYNADTSDIKTEEVLNILVTPTSMKIIDLEFSQIREQIGTENASLIQIFYESHQEAFNAGVIGVFKNYDEWYLQRIKDEG